MNETIHQKIAQHKKPRVHIEYEVETEGASEKKSLPFIVGVMGDFAGDAENKPSLKARKFTQIDQENFNSVMKQLGPALRFKMENHLSEKEGELAVDLRFNKMEDFEPEALVKQVPAMRKILETRNKLRDLLSKSDRSEALEDLLEKALQDQNELKDLAEALNKEKEETIS